MPMRSRALLVCLLSLAGTLAAAAQCPPKTTVSDTLYNADGSPASGRVVIAWQTFHVGPCTVIAGHASVTVENGAFSVALYPNDAATPEGTSYRVTYYLKSGRVSTEYWVVPSSILPVALPAVRSATVPVPNVMFSQAQVNNLISDLARKVELPSPCAAGKFLQANGTSVAPQVACVDGTGAPVASSSQTGTVKTDVTETDPRVYTKASTDTLLAAKANTSHAHSAADMTSGTLDPSRLPLPASTTLGGVKSGLCNGTDKVTGVSTAGSITCAADESGGGSSSQHKVNGTNLAANDPINFGDSSTVAFSNLSAGNISAEVKDASITAVKLNASGPSAGQLSGVGDANIAAGELSPNRVAGTAEVLSSKGAAGGYASLDSSSNAVQDPANAQTTPAASKIPKADGSGKLNSGWLSASVSLLGQTIEDAEIASAYSGTGACTNQFVRGLTRNAAPTCGTVAAADLGVSSPSNAQLSGLGDNNVAAAALSANRISGTAVVQSRQVSATSPLTGGGSLASDLTLGCQTASGSQAGCVSSTDWTTFNNKVPAGRSISTSSPLSGGGDLSADRTLSCPSCTTDANTQTLTNKTLNVESTGNAITTVSKIWLEAASCQSTTAALMWDTPPSNSAVAACITGTNTQKGVADFADSANLSMQRMIAMPSDWVGAIDAKFKWLTTATTGDVVWQIATICVADAETDDPAFNTASTITDTAKGTTNQTNDASITGVTATGCAAGELMHVKIFRDSAHASDSLAATARLIGVELTVRRAQ